MSLLLDALNKADQERKRNDANPSINSAHENAQIYNQRKFSTLSIVLAILVLLVVLLMGVYWLGKSTQQPSPIPINISSTPSMQQSSTASSISLSSASSINSITTNTTENTQPDESVANLYQQKNTPSEPAIVNSTPTETSQPVTAAANSINQFTNLPEIHDLPTNVLNKIPSLNYAGHTPNANGGSVKINGEIKHPNDSLAGGVIIDKILDDGMILHVDNYIFKMRALNSWVNM